MAWRQCNGLLVQDRHTENPSEGPFVKKEQEQEQEQEKEKERQGDGTVPPAALAVVAGLGNLRSRHCLRPRVEGLGAGG